VLVAEQVGEGVELALERPEHGRPGRLEQAQVVPAVLHGLAPGVEALGGPLDPGAAHGAARPAVDARQAVRQRRRLVALELPGLHPAARRMEGLREAAEGGLELPRAGRQAGVAVRDQPLAHRADRVAHAFAGAARGQRIQRLDAGLEVPPGRQLPGGIPEGRVLLAVGREATSHQAQQPPDLLAGLADLVDRLVRVAAARRQLALRAVHLLERDASERASERLARLQPEAHRRG